MFKKSYKTRGFRRFMALLMAGVLSLSGVDMLTVSASETSEVVSDVSDALQSDGGQDIVISDTNVSDPGTGQDANLEGAPETEQVAATVVIPEDGTDADSADVPETETAADSVDAPEAEADADSVDVPETETGTDSTDAPQVDTDVENPVSGGQYLMKLRL